MQGHPPDATSSGEPDPAAVERASKLVASLGHGLASADEVFATFEELDGLPTEVVRDALVALTGEAPSLDRLDNATRIALGMPPKPMVLRPIAIVRDADVLDLGRLAEAQLRIAGETWDGVDRSAEDRLDGESEGSFAGSLERVVLAVVPESGKAPDVRRPMFDVFLFEKDAGAIFKSGTTERVGAIAYGVVELSDRLARAGVQAALAWSQENRPASTPFYLRGAEPKPEPIAPPAKVRAADVRVDATETLDLRTESIAPDSDDEDVSSQAPTRRVAAKKGKRRFVQASFPWAGDPAADPASAKAASKKGAKKAAPKKAATATKKAAPKKAAAKKAAAKKAAPTKKTAAVAKKTAPAKKTAAVAKKTAPAKKTAAVAKKAAPAKKTAAKKTKAAAKTASAKKAAPATKTAAAKKTTPAAKKAVPAKKKAVAKKR